MRSPDQHADVGSAVQSLSPLIELTVSAPKRIRIVFCIMTPSKEKINNVEESIT